MTEKEIENIDLMRAAIEVRVFCEAILVNLQGLASMPEAAVIYNKLRGLVGMTEVALASARELEGMIAAARDAL